jgi:Mg2+/Co2+ transporter CorB
MTIQTLIKDIGILSEQAVGDYTRSHKIDMHEVTQERYKLFLIGHSERVFDNNKDFQLSLVNSQSPETTLKSCMVRWLKGELSIPKNIFNKLNLHHGFYN